MEKFRKHFIAHWFFNINRKLLIMEGAFIYMALACMVLTWGVLNYYNSFMIIPYLIPFAFGFYQFMLPGIKDITELSNHWRTQLRLLKDPKMKHVFNTDYDKWLEKRLDEKFEEENGYKFEDLEFVAVQKWQPVGLVIAVLIVVLIYAI